MCSAPVPSAPTCMSTTTIGARLAARATMRRAAGMSVRGEAHGYGAKPRNATRVPPTRRTVICPGVPVGATPARRSAPSVWRSASGA